MLGELGTGAGGTGSPHAGEPVARRRGNRALERPDPISLPDCKNPKASLVGEIGSTYRKTRGKLKNYPPQGPAAARPAPEVGNSLIFRVFFSVF